LAIFFLKYENFSYGESSQTQNTPGRGRNRLAQCKKTKPEDQHHVNLPAFVFSP